MTNGFFVHFLSSFLPFSAGAIHLLIFNRNEIRYAITEIGMVFRILSVLEPILSSILHCIASRHTFHADVVKKISKNEISKTRKTKVWYTKHTIQHRVHTPIDVHTNRK